MKLFSASLFWLCHIVCLLIAVADTSLRGSERKTVGNSLTPLQEDLPVPLNIFGIDDRTTFDGPLVYPLSAVGKVLTKYWNCTGVMVGPSLMLTAQWCIPRLPDGSPGQLRFEPAYYQGTAPAFSMAEDFFYDYEIDFTDVITEREAAFNYAIVKLADPIGNTDTVGYWPATVYNGEWNGITWFHIGYDPDVQSGESAFYAFGAIDSFSSQALSDGTEAYLMSTSSFDLGSFGQTGGPVFGSTDAEELEPMLIGIISMPAGDGLHNAISGGPGMVAKIAELRQIYG